MNPDLIRHAFSTVDEKHSIFLTRDFVAVQETAYARWEAFAPEIELASNALVDCYQPAFFTRVGLRYQDTVDRRKIPGVENRRWRELINPELIGLLGSDVFHDNVTQQVGNIVLKLDEVPGAEVRINHGLRRIADGALVYTFDADFSLAAQTETNHAPNILDAFHRASGNLFRWAITATLYSALGPQPIA
jgi:uncharacterized protein (TIGR04255 family)